MLFKTQTVSPAVLRQAHKFSETQASPACIISGKIPYPFVGASKCPREAVRQVPAVRQHECFFHQLPHSSPGFCRFKSMIA